MAEKTEKTEITLKDLCAELKRDPREAREMLRLAVRDEKKYPELSKGHSARAAWRWETGSKGLSEARKLLQSEAAG